MRSSNEIKCAKCGDIIVSTHVHDFKRCKCGAIFVDGGDEYCRWGGDAEDILVRKDFKQWKPLSEILHLTSVKELTVDMNKQVDDKGLLNSLKEK